MVMLEGDGIVLLKYQPSSDPTVLSNALFYRFDDGGALQRPEDRSYEEFFSDEWLAAPLCVVSGTALANTRDTGAKQDMQVVKILSFDPLSTFGPH
ncbi:hypothetical protein DL93DRAFT_2087656 [Clavulina sp. PMI_390]|nr:hypothetical protein DL93DRAFT_2087656 [Clavulina sp. PMI_390]